MDRVEPEKVTITVQIGFKKNSKEGQIVTAQINNQDVGHEEGTYITQLKDRKTSCWLLKTVEVLNGDMIKVEAKTGLRGLGPDEERTFTALFKVDVSKPVSEFKMYQVGYGDGIPILKGKFEQIGIVSEKDKRLSTVEEKLEDSNYE